MLNKFKKNFCSKIFKSFDEIPNIHQNLIESFKLKNIKGFSQFQNDIFESLHSNKCTVILANNNSGKKFSILSAIVNRLYNDPMNDISAEDSDLDEELFQNTKKIFQKRQLKYLENLNKKKFKPRGALILSSKFEFLAQLYKLFRKLDHSNQLRPRRLGSSLQHLTPMIEYLDKDEEMVSIELNEMTEISMLNQINNSDWRSIDAMFTTPHMLDFIEHSLNECDPYDINPEIVFIDEFDSVIIEYPKEFQEFLKKYFSSSSSDFSPNVNKSRHLILSSSTLYIDGKNIKSIEDYDRNLKNAINDICSAFSGLNDEIKSSFNLISSSDFMDFVHLIQHINVSFINTVDDNFAKKFKLVLKILHSNAVNTLIICKEDNLKQLREDLIKRQLKLYCFGLISLRVASFIQYSKYSPSILLSPFEYVRGLTFNKLQRIILFDLNEDLTELYKLCSKLDIKSNEKPSIYIMYANKDEENVQNIHKLLQLS